MRRVFVVAMMLGIAACRPTRPAQLVSTTGPVATWVIPESWALGKGTDHGRPIITRFNLALRSVIGHPAFATLVKVTVPLNQSTENGLPTTAENGELGSVEDELERQLTTRNQSLFAGAVTGNNVREFMFYTSDLPETTAKLKSLNGRITRHRIFFAATPDASWSTFKQFAPSAGA